MIFDLILLVACLAAIAGTVVWARRHVTASIERMRAETQRREAALDKQAKVFVRKLETSRRAAMRSIDESHRTLEEAKTLNANTQNFFRDHRVQRFLDRGER